MEWLFMKVWNWRNMKLCKLENILIHVCWYFRVFAKDYISCDINLLSNQFEVISGILFLSELRNISWSFFGLNWGTEKMQVCTNSLMWIEEGNRWWLPQQGRQFLQMWWQLTSHFNTGSDRERPYTEMYSHWSHHQERMSWLHSQCRFLGWLWEVSFRCLTGLHFWRHLLCILHLACLSGGNTYNDGIICKVGGNLLSEAMIRVSWLFSFGN